MPSSQLKRLKSSLREQGIVGPQKSKKQKKKASKDGSFKEGRVQRNTALQEIREQFNPFEIRAPTRTKYEPANNKSSGGNAAKSIISRPGITKGLGEEKVLLHSTLNYTVSTLILRCSVARLCWSRCSEERK